MNYKSGDLVKITGNSNHHEFSTGETVRLKQKCRDGVWTAEYLDGRDYWYVNESDMKPAKPATMPQKIIVTTDGKTTLARLFDGKTMVKRAEAKCSPSDVFDFGVGAELAVNRLMGDKPATEPVKESEPVKLYCVKDCENWLVKGHIYGIDKRGHFVYEDGDATGEKFKCVGDIIKTWLGGYLAPLVRRPAKVGEWVTPTIDDSNAEVEKNEIYKVLESPWALREGSVRVKPLGCCGIISNSDYLVLDGYHGDPA